MDGHPDLTEQVREMYKSDVVPMQIQLNPYDWVIGLTFPLGDMKVHLRVVSDEVASEEVLRVQYQVEQETKKVFCDTTYKSGCLSKYSKGLRRMLTTFRGAPPKGLF